MSLSVSRFGITPEGDPVARFVLERDGLRVELIEYGASLVRLRAPDRDGRPGDVVLGLADSAAHWDDPSHFGAVPGRFANRIARGRFSLDGREIQLVRNDGAHHLHGGPRGFGRRVWRGVALHGREEDAVRFELDSPDGDQGYPGRLEASACYRLGPRGQLRVELRARSQAPTIVNLTQHAYFHLGDGGATPILDHRLRIAADEVLEIDDEGIPSGRRLRVAGTPFDLREPARLGDRLASVASPRGGFDHCYLLRGDAGVAARLVEPRSGRCLELETNQPGLQLYTGNGLADSLAGHGGIAYGRWHALCLEPQALPDAPNHPGFPSVRLEPGDEYVHDSLFRFGVEP